MRVRLKGLYWTKSKAGKFYYYAWKGGPRIHAEHGTPAFFEEFRAAHSKQNANLGTLREIITMFEGSAEFRKLAPRTRDDYAKHLRKIEAKWGGMPLAGFSAKKLRGPLKAWRDELARQSMRQADYTWSVLARLFSVAVERGLVDENPCARGGRLYRADRTEAVWTDDDEAAFLKSAPAHLHLPILLALWTGQRQGDLLALTWFNYDGERIRLRQGKTGRRVSIPVGAPLKAALDAAKRDEGPILRTAEGRAWTPDGFRVSWRKAVARAGIVGLTFHDLRGTAVTRLALVGCTVPEIASLTGHSERDVHDILDAHYLARDPRLADSAIKKLEGKKL